MKNDSIPIGAHIGKFITCSISHLGKSKLSLFVNTDKALATYSVSL